MEMVYKPKRQYSWLVPTTKVSAEVAGAVMEQIEETQGVLTKENFLEASRAEDSPTHKLFEWDNDKAAEKYRLTQSGRYIANMRVTIETEQREAVSTSVTFGEKKENDRPETVRAFMSISKDRTDRAVYINHEKAMSDEKLRATVLEHAAQELEMFQKKYERYMELAKVFSAIDEFKEKVS